MRKAEQKLSVERQLRGLAENEMDLQRGLAVRLQSLLRNRAFLASRLEMLGNGVARGLPNQSAGGQEPSGSKMPPPPVFPVPPRTPSTPPSPSPFRSQTWRGAANAPTDCHGQMNMTAHPGSCMLMINAPLSNVSP